MTDYIAIVGAREASRDTLRAVRETVLALPPELGIVSGGARGVDCVAAGAARDTGRPVAEYVVVKGFPDPDGRREVCIEVDGRRVALLGRVTYRDALIFRNTLIALRCVRMVAFVEGSKGGTWDAVEQAKRFRRPCEVIR